MIKKVERALILLIVILAIVLVTFSNYAKQKGDVSKKIGNKIYGGTISTIDFAKVTKVYNTYITMLKNGEYQNAYDSLSYEYTEFKDYGSFLKDIKNGDIKLDGKISEIRQLTEYMYMINITCDDGSKIQNLVIYHPNSARYQIVPDTLIEHTEMDKKIKKDSLLYEILETNNYVNRFVLTMKITSFDKKNVATITEIKLNKNDGLRKVSANIDNIVLEPLEEKYLTIEFETNIDFPEEIDISRTFPKDGSMKTYKIKLK